MTVKKKVSVTQHGLVRTSLHTGWNIINENFWVIFRFCIVAFLLGNVADIADRILGDQSVIIDGGVRLISWILNSAMAVGLAATMLKLVDGKEAGFRDLFPRMRKIVSYWLVAFLQTLLAIVLILGPLVFFVVSMFVPQGPSDSRFLLVLSSVIVSITVGLYITLRQSLAIYLIADKDMGAIKAIRESWRHTKGKTFELLSLVVILGLLNLVGLLAIGVGLLITIPMSLVASAQAYRLIVSKK